MRKRSSKPKTKNDVAWEKLFSTYAILDEIKKEGLHIISAAQINKVRESRLMTKFDQSINLPQIFSDNSLSILPISRSKYIIAPISTHHGIKYDPSIEVTEAHLPDNIESIDFADLYSEAIALNCAFNAGIIDDLMGEKTFHTISGRMSTANFTFSIDSKLPEQSPFSIDVNNSQCEIDGGFEGDSCFALVEAKNYTVDDFLIRQLYYPYRLWLSKLSARKKVIPIFMTFSQDTFDFFIYEFTSAERYNSLELVQQRRYAIAPEEISRDDVSRLFEQIRLVSEPDGVPFPQANTFDRVVDLLSLLTTKAMTRDEITENYEFDTRQTNYYTDAARYLGLIHKFTDPETQEITFMLTDEALQLFRRSPRQKYLGLIRKILEHPVFYQTFQATQQGIIPTTEDISQIIENCAINIRGDTVGRRASTVRGWVEWIWKRIDE